MKVKIKKNDEGGQDVTIMVPLIKVKTSTKEKKDGKSIKQ